MSPRLGNISVRTYIKSQESFQRDVRATSILRRLYRKKTTNWHATSSRCSSTLQISLRIVIRPITGPHINRSPSGLDVNGKTPVYAALTHAVGVYCERIMCARMRFVYSNGVENLFRSVGRGSRAVVNMNVSTCWALPSETSKQASLRPLRADSSG